MIVGNGLIASSVRSVDVDDVILFCSGVSNSSETNPDLFKRETDLILQQDNSKLIVYFSTISIFNSNYKGQKYRAHKINCENIITSHFPKHIILRLPNVVSLEGNRNNLFPYFYNSIINNHKITIYKDAVRYLIAAEDIAPIVQCLFDQSFFGAVNACFNDAPKVLDIYKYMCQKLEKSELFVFGESEDHPVIENTGFMDLIRNSGCEVKTSWKAMIDSYLQFETARLS